MPGFRSFARPCLGRPLGHFEQGRGHKARAAAAALAQLGAAGGRADIVGYDSVSAVLFPYGASFVAAPAGANTTIADISAVGFVSARQVVLLADRSHLYTANLTFGDDRGLREVEFLSDTYLNYARCRLARRRCPQ
ncbi:unnamed protein product [Prorocentrum cordatum]|uniref:Uncharacterized protein n=1 Tax=Prorocentrum cordatum TaxID=2364126 RepID=A0ABN9V6B7_9DINO|nr:unnamed protein product [Polarella glacialis]